MARRKKVYSHYEKAVTRLASVKSIGENVKLTGDASVANYETQIAAFRKRMDDYNTTLSAIDAQYSDLMAAEKELKNSSERVLAGVAYQFGKDSNEYEQAGGSRKGNRKRNVKKIDEGGTPPPAAA